MVGELDEWWGNGKVGYYFGYVECYGKDEGVLYGEGEEEGGGFILEEIMVDLDIEGCVDCFVNFYFCVLVMERSKSSGVV